MRFLQIGLLVFERHVSEDPEVKIILKPCVEVMGGELCFYRASPSPSPARPAKKIPDDRGNHASLAIHAKKRIKRFVEKHPFSTGSQSIRSVARDRGVYILILKTSSTDSHNLTITHRAN